MAANAKFHAVSQTAYNRGDSNLCRVGDITWDEGAKELFCQVTLISVLVGAYCNEYDTAKQKVSIPDFTQTYVVTSHGSNTSSIILIIYIQLYEPT